MRTRVLTTAAIVAAVVVLWIAAWPPAPRRTTGSPDPDLRRRTLAGAFHVHSQQSDGSGTRSGIAAAAARASLQFIVFTDHGDATRQPEAPSYSSGVLCIDAVEISTTGGHYVALGVAKAPYRLGGEPSAVVEDVRRLGGFGIVAHPDSPKPALAWKDWTVDADGVEWLNADSEWRNESWPSLGRSLLGYLARPGPALAAMLDRPVVTLSRWDAMTTRRQMPAFAAHDAHGGLGGTLEGRLSPLRIPSYESSFRSFAMRAVLRSPPAGNASEDAALLLDALRAGRTYTAIDGVAAPAWLEFQAEREGQVAAMGERLAGSGPARLTARVPTLEGSVLVFLRSGLGNATVVAQTPGGEASALISEPGAYRVELRPAGGGSRPPWILSNPIYIDLPPQASPQPVSPASEIASLAKAEWRTEHDPSSSAAVITVGDRTGMTFRMGQGTVSTFAALVAPLPRPAPVFDAVLIDLASESPARVSVQFRSADGAARWGKSVYVSPEAGTTVLRTADLVPAEAGGRSFDPVAAESVLLVVDLVNSRPGTSGRIIVRNLALARSR
jgi:hypothetical protein